MKARLERQLSEALAALQAEGVVPAELAPTIVVTRTRDSAHGDFASNLAMQLAKPAGRAPRDIADALIQALPPSDEVREVVIAGPGFINFFMADRAQSEVVERVLAEGDAYGRGRAGAGQRVQVEFVSANPTGPLHVGHGRGAALGATLANLLDAAGYEVQREYYVNDAGRQMNILALSVWLRYLERGGRGGGQEGGQEGGQRGEVGGGQAIRFPSNGYRGGYVREIAEVLRENEGDAFVRDAAALFDGIPDDEVIAEPHAAGIADADALQDTERHASDTAQPVDTSGGDKEAHVDALIERARDALGEHSWRVVFDTGLDFILGDIREDLGEFGVRYDEWFSERSIQDDIPGVIARLERGGHLYERDGVRWFRSTEFGDDKDRVVVRENGQPTYFASDIAYVDNKLARGFDRVLYVFGADHHGYTTRLVAACEALGHDPQRLEFLLIQFAILYRGAQRVQMSTRSGSFVTLRELRDEVGSDAARFFYVMRRYQQHLDFDLELAKSNSNENPVYYVQYAHARICSVLRELDKRGLSFERRAGLDALDRLSENAEAELMTRIAAWPEVVERAALAREPHQITGYLRELAHGLHSYYNGHKVLVEDDALRQARLCLLLAVRQVLVNGLTLIDVSTPEVM